MQSERLALDGAFETTQPRAERRAYLPWTRGMQRPPGCAHGMAQAMTSRSLTIDVRMPRNQVPGGGAEVVHRGGGHYVSVIGSNVVFHNPSDRGPDVIHARAIATFVEAFATVAQALAGREPFRS